MHIKLIIQVDIVCLHKICNFFNYMQNASVLIDGSVMRKACGDEKTAKWLEENLAIMPDVKLH